MATEMAGTMRSTASTWSCSGAPVGGADAREGDTGSSSKVEQGGG